MKKGLTEIVFILDRSGSMDGLESDTIGGFNSMIAKQRTENGDAIVSTVLFDNTSEVLHDRIPIENIKPMTERDYYVRGCTALLDAIGGAIHHIGNVHKYAQNEDVPEHTMFIITTDGMENASRVYSADEIFPYGGGGIGAAALAGERHIPPIRPAYRLHLSGIFRDGRHYENEQPQHHGYQHTDEGIHRGKGRYALQKAGFENIIKRHKKFPLIFELTESAACAVLGKSALPDALALEQHGNILRQEGVVFDFQNHLPRLVRGADDIQ